MNKLVSKNRLLKLADFLEKLPPERFNYAHWVGLDWKGDPNLSCGTTACALGWATTIPSLQKAGLTLHQPREACGAGFVALCGEEPPNYLTENSISEMAAMRVFGLTSEEATFLFYPYTDMDGHESPNQDASAKVVAKHIRRFCRRYR